MRPAAIVTGVAPAGRISPSPSPAGAHGPASLSTTKKRLGRAMARIDFAVMEVPGGDPAPWESGVPLARYLPFERPAKIHGRVIFYRMPILSALRTDPDPRMLIHSIVTSQLATALNRMPEDIDYLAG